VDDSWVSLEQFPDRMSAQVVAGRIGIAGIHSYVSSPPGSVGVYYLRVPPNQLDRAKKVLQDCAIPESELADLAMGKQVEISYPKPLLAGTHMTDAQGVMIKHHRSTLLMLHIMCGTAAAIASMSAESPSLKTVLVGTQFRSGGVGLWRHCLPFGPILRHIS
jgi:hypothetical protein